jgi:predicted dehydrogenase
MASRRVGVAQLSFWFVHAEEFCHRAQLTPGVEFVAAWDNDEARGRDHSAAHGVRFEPDLERLLARDDIDAVSICAEPFRHPELVEAAAAAGKHILIEKPMAGSVEGARRIVAAQQRHGVQIMPAYNLRYHPLAQYVKSVVEDGSLGEIVRVRRLHGHYFEAEDAAFKAGTMAADWSDPIAEHRDSLFFAGSHVALWYAWMFGVPSSVSCMRHNVIRGLPVEDNATAILNYQGRFTGVMEVSETLIAQQAVSEIYGTDGVLIQRRGNLPSTRVRDSSRSPILLFDRKTDTWRAPSLPPHFLRHESKYNSVGVFLDALLHDEPVPDGPASGLDSIAILQAAEVASKERREVELAEVLGP